MIEILARPDGDALVPVRAKDRQALQKAPRSPMMWTGREPRNRQRHKLFFAVLGLAFDNWPESHEFQPVDAEHLRAWLLVEAGWCDTLGIPVRVGGEDRGRTAVAATLMFAGATHCFLSLTRKGFVTIKRPKSQSFSKMNEAQAAPVVSAVFDILRSIGLDPERLIEEAGK